MDQNNMWLFGVLFSGALIRKLCFLSFLFLSVNSAALNDRTWTYELDGNSVTVTGCSGAACPSDIAIPNIIEGKNVTAIGAWAYRYEQLTSVIIPDGISIIGPRAFKFNKLTRVTIPANVTRIDAEAFGENPLMYISFLGPRPSFRMGANGAFTNIYGPLLIISYCEGLPGWPGDDISGVTPVPDDKCDTDDDGITNGNDAFPSDPSETMDSDGDGMGDNADVFPFDPTETHDADQDGIGNNTDSDDDNDGIPDDLENETGRNPLGLDYMTSVGVKFSCAMETGAVVCWGDNAHGQTAVPALSNPSTGSSRLRTRLCD